MAQGSKPRHSRTTRKPVTIDLEPEAVSDNKAATEPAAKEKAGGAKAASAAAKSQEKSSAKTAGGEQSGDGKSKGQREGETKAGTVKEDKSPSAKPAETPAKKTADKPVASAAPSSDAGKEQTAGSGMRILGTGVAAAVVAIALFAGLQWTGVLPVPGSNAGGAAGSNILADDLEALKQSVATLEKGASVATGEVGLALENRIDALEAAVGSSAGSGEAETRLAELENKVAAITSPAGDAGASANSEIVTGLGDKISAIEKAQTSQQASLQSIESSISDLGKKITADEQAQEQTIKALEGRLAAIEKTLDAPREDIKVARALAAASLKAAIDRGGSFMAELEAFASVDGDSPTIDQLRSLAAAGVPSRATLLTRLPASANAMISADETGTASGGLFDHLLSSATSLVKVRPVGEVAGDSVEAIVARLETRMKNGDLQGAVDEWNTLPQASKDASQDYMSDVQARIEAEKLVSGAITAALPSTPSNTGTASQDGSAGSAQTGEQN
jgi:hypothetical protein